ncbi:protein of unknown function [Burkholderia multivorans]
MYDTMRPVAQEEANYGMCALYMSPGRGVGRMLSLAKKGVDVFRDMNPQIPNATGVAVPASRASSMSTEVTHVLTGARTKPHRLRRSIPVARLIAKFASPDAGVPTSRLPILNCIQ